MSGDVPHILTVDLEDWYHCLEPEPDRWACFQPRAEEATDLLLELLTECQAEATFFVVGAVAEKHPAVVRRVRDAGHEIAVHGQYHRFVYTQTPREFEADLRRSLQVLEDLTGAPIRSYRAPYFSVTRKSLWALDIIQDAGITNDSSIFPVVNHRYGIPDAQRTPHEVRPSLVEWPVSTLPTPLGNAPFGGGCYLRFLPEQLIQWGVRLLERRGEPIILYIHPWELDPDQPEYRGCSRFLHFRHYHGLRKTAGKLRRLLCRARYLSLASVAKTWSLGS